MPEELVNQPLPTAADIIAASPADPEPPEDPPEVPEPKETKPKARNRADDDDEDTDPEPEPQEEEPVADDEPPDPDGDDPEETSFKAPADVIEFLKTSPEGKKHAKRIEDAYKGLAKKEKQISTRESELDTLVKNKPQVDYLVNVASRLSDPKQWRDTLNEIISDITKQHGVKPADILGSKNEPATPVPDSDDEETLKAEAQKLGLDYQGDVKVIRKALALAKDQTDAAVKAALESFGIDPSQMKEAMKVIEEQRSQKEGAEWVEKSAPFIISRAAKGDNPFPGVTKEMVAKAHLLHPGLPARELVEKLPYVFPLEFKKAGTNPAKKGPEMIHGGAPKGNAKVPNKHPGDMTFADLMKARAS